MGDESYLGTGMKFPPQVNPATGRFMVSSGPVSVKESIYLILMTQKTERMVRPSFGSSIMSYTFMDTTDTMLNIMARDIKTDILTQEPRISEVSVTMDAKQNPGSLFVSISYTLAADNTRDNLVFPFYLNTDVQGEEDEEFKDI